MVAKEKHKKPYSEKSDLEKIKANWKKIKGLYERRDWSAAIVRAATAVEIAANLVIRQELEKKRDLEVTFVNALLLSANGIQGKIRNLIIPLSKISKDVNISKELTDTIERINKVRNSIVHSGQFKNKTTAKEILTLSKQAIEELVKHYNDNFKLNDIR